MRIDLLRHGACDDHVFLRGRVDSPLSVAGQEQMHRAIAELPKPHKIITSPAQRCRVFAETHFTGVDSWPELQERDFGSWDGLSLTELQRAYPKMLESYFADPFADIIPKSESLPDFEIRVKSAWDRLCQLESEHILVLTHSGVQRVLLKQLLGMPNNALFNLKLDYAARLTFEVSKTDQGFFSHLLEIRQYE